MINLLSLLLTTMYLDESPLPKPLPEEPPIDPSRISPGLLGGMSFIFLIIAMVLLYRSMRKQMTRVSSDLPMGPGDQERAADAQMTEEAEERGSDEPPKT